MKVKPIILDTKKVWLAWKKAEEFERAKGRAQKALMEAEKAAWKAWRKVEEAQKVAWKKVIINRE